MKTNNPANINSQNAKKAGLSYWAYMEKNGLTKVSHHDWNSKKVRVFG